MNVHLQKGTGKVHEKMELNGKFILLQKLFLRSMHSFFIILHELLDDSHILKAAE